MREEEPTVGLERQEWKVVAKSIVQRFLRGIAVGFLQR